VYETEFLEHKGKGWIKIFLSNGTSNFLSLIYLRSCHFFNNNYFNSHLIKLCFFPATYLTMNRFSCQRTLTRRRTEANVWRGGGSAPASRFSSFTVRGPTVSSWCTMASCRRKTSTTPWRCGSASATPTRLAQGRRRCSTCSACPSAVNFCCAQAPNRSTQNLGPSSGSSP
jgi:hypothetical protein